MKILSVLLVCIGFGQLRAVAPAPLQNYFPVVVVNNTGQPSNQIYFVAHGNDPDGIPCFFLPNTTTGICTYEYPVPSGEISSITSSVLLSDLPLATGTAVSGANTFLIYLPNSSAARGYFSINKIMYLPTKINPALDMFGVVDSSVTSYTDANFYTVYQDFEFGIPNVSAATNSSLAIYLNLSWVDYFCLPMQLATYSYPSNSGIVIDPTCLPAGTLASLSRGQMLTQMQNKLTASGVPAAWGKLGIPFYTNPYTDSTPFTTVRILAAKNSISLAGTTPQPAGFKVTPKYFNTNYATSSTQGPSTGVSYMQAVYNYYYNSGSPRSFYTQIIPQGISGAVVYQITGNPTALTLDLNCVEGGGPNYTLLLGNSVSGVVTNGGLTTEELLGGSGPTWGFTLVSGVDSAAYTNELAKVISALFSIGYWPYPNTTGTTAYPTNPPPTPPNCPVPDATHPFFDSNCGFYHLPYFTNANGFTTGLWYNLYDKALHQLEIGATGGACSGGCVPSNPTLGLGYGYDYDDLLNMSGIIAGILSQDQYGNPSQAAGAIQPYAVISLGTVETSTIPVLFNSTYNYNVTAAAAPGGTAVTFIYYDVHGVQHRTLASATTNTDLGMVYVSPSELFQMEFAFVNADDPAYPYNYTYTFDLDLQHQIAIPASSETVFRGSDQAFQTSIQFNINGGTQTNPTFLIEYDSAPPTWPG